MKKTIFYFAFILLSLNVYSSTFRIVGYLPSYRFYAINSIDFSKMTHVCYSFANPDTNGVFSFPGDLTLLKSKAKASNCKIYASIGGGGLSETIEHIYETHTEPAKVTNFVHEIMNYLRKEQLDGIDVDLEGSLVQMATYNDFVIQLADSVHAQGLQISAALVKWTGSSVSKAAADALDFINVMSYDQTGPWTAEGPHSTYDAAVNDFNYWHQTRLQAADKIVLGVPFYGYEFKTTGNTVAKTWCQIVSAYPNDLNNDEVTTAQGTLYYNGRTTIQKKTQFMMDQKAGGIMIWELGQDCFNSSGLMQVIQDTKNGTIGQEDVQHQKIKVNLRPNPVVDQLQVKGLSTMFSYQVFGLNGCLLLSGKSNQTIAVSSLSSGTYVLKLITPEFTDSLVFIKE